MSALTATNEMNNNPVNAHSGVASYKPRRANKWIKGLALALAIGVSATACGGGGDDPEAGQSIENEVDGFGIGVEDDPAPAGDAAAPNEAPAEANSTDNEPADVAPGGLTGPLEAGTTYSATIAAVNEATLTVPASSVLSMSVEGEASNSSSVGLRLESPDLVGGAFLQVGPGGSETDERALITVADGDQEMAVIADGQPADQISFSFEIASQTEGDGEFADAGDNIGVAAPLSSGETINGLLGDADQSDHFGFEVAAGGVINVALEVPAEESGSMWAELFYNGERKGSVNAAAGGANEFRYVVAEEESGDWFVEVTGGGAYELTTTAEAQNDGGSGRDAGAELADAVEIEPGTITGVLGNADDEDLYVLKLEPGQLLNASLTVDPTGSGVSYLDPILNGSSLGYISVNPGGVETTAHVFSADESGQLVIEVSNGDSAYTMEVSLGGQDDAGSGTDAGSDASTAVEVAVNSTFDGVLGNDDSHDFYSFVAEDTGVVSYTISRPADTSGTGYLTPSVNGTDQSYVTVTAGVEAAGEIVVEAGETVYLDVESIKGPYTVVLGTGENSPQIGEDSDDEVGLDDEAEAQEDAVDSDDESVDQDETSDEDEASDTDSEEDDSDEDDSEEDDSEEEEDDEE